MKINIKNLGSTSYGNCTLIWDNTSALMIDCGFSSKYITQNLEDLEIDFSFISGMIITHTHSDHLKSSVLNKCLRENINIYCHENIGKELVENYEVLSKANNMRLLKTFDDSGFRSGSFIVHGFKVPHDSKSGCYGFNIYKRIKSGIKKITIATDLAYPTKEVIKRFVNSDVIIIEANHDIEMLNRSNRSAWLKSRIKERGHLSNDQCADVLIKVIRKSRKHPKAVILAHISQECNSKSLALNNITTVLNNNNLHKIKLFLTHKLIPNDTVILT